MCVCVCVRVCVCVCVRVGFFDLHRQLLSILHSLLAFKPSNPSRTECNVEVHRGGACRVVHGGWCMEGGA